MDRSLSELVKRCKELKIKGYSGKSKKEVMKLVTEHETLAAPVPVPVQVPVSATFSIETWTNRIQQGDCLEKMRLMPSNSVDMVCTDPPYFLDGLDADWNKSNLDKKGASSVVGNLPKGMKFDRKQSKTFYDFYTTVSTEIFRILKPGGAFLSFSSPRLYHSMAMAMEHAGFEIRDMLGWIYTQSQVKAFSQDHIINKDKIKTDAQKEELRALCDGWKTPQLKPAIEPICLAVKPIEGRYIDNFEKYGTGLMNTTETEVGDHRFPSNIMTTEDIGYGLEKVFLIAKPNKAEKGDYNTHLSVKPVQLIQHLIRLFTRENAIVMDPFMGSGTTAVACVQSNRRYMGFDLNQEYIAVSEQRVNEAK